MRIFTFSLLLVGFVYSGNTAGQVSSDNLVQFSGIVVTADSINPIPFTSITIKDTWRGTIADYFGYFSLVAKKGDTIEFSAIGFKRGKYIIPDTITKRRYSLIQVLSKDTILLPQTVIYPWPSKEQFEEAFLSFDVPDDDYERAKKNLDMSEMREVIANYPSDPSLNFKYSMYEQQQKLYYIGQTQPITILNPFAWAQFVKAWKEGKFKRQKDKD
ncbi:MAG: carboxypeptidase-like regulatory domain-containing protein [Bacteroidales bacterium]|nr:carboxypeptidase-like regulatory domain-containing protein [Bacteroidales bacterium]